jgi:integrase
LGTAALVGSIESKIDEVLAQPKQKRERAKDTTLFSLPLSPVTVLKHLRLMRGAILHAAHNGFFLQASQPIPTQMLLDFVEDRRIKHGNKWSTVSTNLGNMLGAWRRAQLYVAELVSVNLIEDQLFKAALDNAKQQAKTSVVNSPHPLTAKQFHKVVDYLLKTGKTAAAIAAILTWCTAARIGDVLTLEANNVIINKSHTSVGFYLAKTCRSRGPYHVHTSLGRYERIVRNYVMDHKDKMWTESTHSEVVEGLKAVHWLLEARSMRRGALITMAQNGVDDETLMEFSGHQTKKMLHRYLTWGLHRGAAAQKCTEAARFLH